MLICFLLLVAHVMGQSCNPLYPRLFYTNVREKLIIKYDTLDSCEFGYVTISQNSSITKFRCSIASLPFDNLKIFVHTCNINISLSYQSFKYNFYGAFEETVHIPQEKQIFRLVAIADWGPIEKKHYVPVKESFQTILQQSDENKIAGLMIVGDIAYELYTDDGQQYIKFMQELSQVSPYWPIIFVTGNHEWYENSISIFNIAFEALGLNEKDRVEVFQFWKLKIISFDPFLQNYNKSTTEKYEVMKQRMIKEIQQTDESNFVVVTSHYPFICSQQVAYCRNMKMNVPDLFQYFSSSKKVDLYLGAHMHQYERIYPYQNKNFVQKESPYKKGEFVSIVQGVGGTDIGMKEEDYQVQDFSAFHTANKTGFGLIQIKNIDKVPTVTYSHMLTEPLMAVGDQIIFELQEKNLRIS